MTTPQPAVVPLAITLDEPTLRTTFPSAPAELAVPRDVGALFKQRMRTVGGPRRQMYIATWGVSIVVGLGLAFAGYPMFGGGFTFAAIVAAITVLVIQYGRAGDDFYGRYAEARGLTHVEKSHVNANVPLFARGDKREWPRVMSGTIAGQDAKLGLFTYTDVSRDSEGNRTETDYDFTFVHFQLPADVASRFAGVYLSPKKLGFGKLQDSMAHDRKVVLESAEFSDRYTLRVVDEQDDIALYELFSTTFIHHLATELKVYWEQRGDSLVIWRKSHEKEAADLDRMCVDASHVLQRYLEEAR